MSAPKKPPSFLRLVGGTEISADITSSPCSGAPGSPRSRGPCRTNRLADDAEALTATCKNKRLRRRRFDDWLKADAVMDYWHAQMMLSDAVSRVQMHGASEGRNHSTESVDDRYRLLNQYRKAKVRLLLTPAHNKASVNWKRAVLESGDYIHFDIEREQLERAIADDVAFLDVHPTRRPRLRG